jgi:hypothetical protein
MDKYKAAALSKANKFSLGDLRQMIANARTRGGMSRVNKSITIEQACDIYAAAFGTRHDDHIPSGLLPDYRGIMRPTKDSLIIKNILRDCA